MDAIVNLDAVLSNQALRASPAEVLILESARDHDGWFVKDAQGHCLKYCFTHWGAVWYAKRLLRRWEAHPGRYREVITLKETR